MKFIDISFLFLLGIATLTPSSAHAFSKLINGLESMTSSYLIPLAGVVAGACFIIFVTLSYFRQEEYQRKVANIVFLCVIAATGLEIINTITGHFR